MPAAVTLTVVAGVVTAWSVGRDDPAAIGPVTSVTSVTDAALGLEPADTTPQPDPVSAFPASTSSMPTTDATAESIATGTGVSVPLPAVGDVASEWTHEFGPLWVVHHRDGSVSVLPGVIVTRVDGTADMSAPVGVGFVVAWSPSGRAFTAGVRTFDEWGRTVDGERSNDLAAFVGTVDGTVVNISTTTSDRIGGDPEPIGTSSDLELPALPAPSGAAHPLDTAGWLVLDEWLVIANGIGTLCGLDVVLDCDGTTGRVTAISSPETERTAWLPAPLIAHLDQTGSVDRAASLNGVFPTPQPTVVEAGPSCGANDGPTARVRFSAPDPVDVIVEVRRGDTLIGTATASLTDDLPWKTVQVPLAGYVDADDPSAEIVIRSVAPPQEQLAVGAIDFSLDRRDFGCPI